MTPKQLAKLESLHNRWRNDPSSHDRDVEIPADVMDLLPDVLTHITQLEYGCDVGTAELKASQKECDELKAERDAALKACVEMRKQIDCAAIALEFWYKMPNPTPAQIDVAREALRVAVSTDCGKGYVKAESLRCFRCDDGHTPLYCLNCAREGYHKDDEWKIVVEALDRLLIHAIEFYGDWNKGDFQLGQLAQCDMLSMAEQFNAAKKALAHAEKLMGKDK